MSHGGGSISSFVTRKGTRFVLGGKPFYFGGANHHYLHYDSPGEVAKVLDDAVAMNLRVLRVWAFIDVGSLDGTTLTGGVAKKCVWEPWGGNAYDGQTKGVYFQYWDTAAERPGYNDGQNGLERLDYALAEAARRDLKLILVLSNNWKHFGGVDQYAEWYGASHNEFFTDPRCRQAFKDWAAHLVNRINHITGVCYRNDPTIFSWELMNEPHADGAPASVVTEWVREMSAFLKDMDPNHLVALGDEGFFTRRDAPDLPADRAWKYNGCTGMSYEAITSLETIDYGTFHLYPDYWNETWQWGSGTWIPEHAEVAAAAGKPCVLGEFGFKDPKLKAVAYDRWLESVAESGVAGFQFWRLIGRQADGSYPLDGEGFDVHYPSHTAALLAEWAERMARKS